MDATSWSVASGMAKESCHLVKWSTSTSIQLLPLAVSGIRPTKSTATFCQGRPAYNLCFPYVNRLVVLGIPEWAKACVLHIALPLSASGHTAHHLGLPWRATWASNTSPGHRRSESLCLCSCPNSALPISSCSSATSTLLSRSWYMTATGPVPPACSLANSASVWAVQVSIFCSGQQYVIRWYVFFLCRF